METVTGSDLLETFQELGINTGNVSKLTVEAWFDTNCEATKEMLHWLCKSLSKENVLTAHENEEYEQALLDKSLLNGVQCEKALSEIQEDYTGILDYDQNCLDIQLMENEIAMLKEKEHHLESLLKKNEIINKKLSKEVQKINREEVNLIVAKDGAQFRCTELSCKLDDEHEKLRKQITHYAEHLNEFEYATRPTFISNVPAMKYDQLYYDITSYLDLHIRKEKEILSCFESTVKSVRKAVQYGRECSVESVVNQLDVIQLRIFLSIKNYLRFEVEEETLKAEIKFLQGLNLSEIISGAPPDVSSSFLLEANIVSKEELLECVYLDMESVIKHVCDGLIDTPNLNLINATMLKTQKKLKNLTQLDSKIREILSNHILLYLLLKKEKTDLQSTDKFFRDVHRYIFDNLENCLLRTKSMYDVINNYKIYSALPIEEKFPIVNVIRSLLTNDSNLSAIDVINNFNMELAKLEQEVFAVDSVAHQQFTQKIHREITIMEKYLRNGPTNQINLVPAHILEGFNKIVYLHETQERLFKSAIGIMSDAQKEITNNKWFKIRRLLWVWFTFEPKKVISAIEGIETAIKNKRSENV